MVKVVLIDTPKVVVKGGEKSRVGKMGWDQKREREREREREGGRQEVREGRRKIQRAGESCNH